MIDLYSQFIETKEIKKDINFYFNRLKDKILTDVFPKYLCDRRRKMNRNYDISEYLSSFDKTALKFNKDEINISFIIGDDNQNEITIKNLEYKDYCLEVELNIIISLSVGEKKNKLIYEHNRIFHLLKKTINELKEFHRKHLYEDEIKYNTILNDRFIEYSNNNNHWQNLLHIMIQSTDPCFEKKLNRFDVVINGIKSETLDKLFMVLHKTAYYNSYKKQVGVSKFRRALYESGLSAYDLAKCFNHELNPKYNTKFLEDLILHYNQIIFKLLTSIDLHITDKFRNK